MDQAKLTLVSNAAWNDDCNVIAFPCTAEVFPLEAAKYWPLTLLLHSPRIISCPTCTADLNSIAKQ